MSSIRSLCLSLVALLTIACNAGRVIDQEAPVTPATPVVQDTPLELDPECELGDYDYVVRGVWPRAKGDQEVNLLMRNGNVRNANVLEYEVHACKAVIVAGGAFWFQTTNGFRGEENVGDLRDATGMIIGELQGNWLTRFYGFSLTVNGDTIGNREAEEWTLSDESGGPQWHDLSYKMQAGDVLNFALTASVRDANMPTYESFVVEYAPVVNSPDGTSASGLELTVLQSVRLIN